MKKGILFIIVSLIAFSSKPQDCDSAAYIFWGNFESLYICGKSIKLLPEKYWGIAYELTNLSVRDKSNKILLDFPSPGEDAYRVTCFNDSITIHERFELPLVTSEYAATGLQDVYKHTILKTATGFHVKREDVHKDLTVSSDSLKRIVDELEEMIYKNNLFENDPDAFVKKYNTNSNSLSVTRYYWLVFVGYYNDDKKCQLYLKEFDKYEPFKANDDSNPEWYSKIRKNILWYKILKNK